jgi:3-oxoadipate enol-lactonase
LSMGGYVSFAIYRKFPSRVVGLILAATRSGPDSPQARENRQKTVELVRSSGVPSVVDTMLPRLLAPKTFTTNPELVEQVKDIMLSSTVEGIIGDSLGMKDRPDATGSLSGIRLPTLILLGSEDQIIPVRDAEGMHSAIRNSRLVIVPNAGHLLNMEQPEIFNREVRDFIHSFTGGK